MKLIGVSLIRISDKAFLSNIANEAFVNVLVDDFISFLVTLKLPKLIYLFTDLIYQSSALILSISDIDLLFVLINVLP